MDDVLIKNKISEEGEIDSFYELIGKDAEDTPLHKAASAGQTCLAVEVMNLMPSFARKLNKDGLSPMHLALLKGHSELVLLLLRADQELVRVKGRGGTTPLHCATQIGSIHVLAIFLAACPRSIEDMTVESETVFHIAVKNNRIEALEVLVGWLNRVCHKDVFSWKENIPNWRDKNGHTVLDIALSHMQTEAIQLLTEINAENSKGQTALGALLDHTKMDRREIRQMLHNARRTAPLPIIRLPKKPITLENYLRSRLAIDEIITVRIRRLLMKISEGVLNALLVVAGLIITTTFQVPVSLPGDLRQAESGDPNTTAANGGSPSKLVWKSSLSEGDLAAFLISNTALLLTAIWITCILLSDSELGVMLGVLLAGLLTCYLSLAYAIAPDKLTYFLTSLPSVFFVTFLVVTMLLYVRGRKKIALLLYNANKCPKQAVAEEVQESGTRTTSNESGAPNNTSV